MAMCGVWMSIYKKQGSTLFGGRVRRSPKAKWKVAVEDDMNTHLMLMSAVAFESQRPRLSVVLNTILFRFY